jgi:hypothetical protein
MVLRYFSFAILYVAQGIPEGMTLFGIPAWMAINGKTAAEIGGYTAIIFIPVSFKILAAPLMERFTSPSSWSPDGKLLVYSENDDVLAVPVTGDHKPITIIGSQFIERFAQVSPDGKWLAYQSLETGRAEIYVRQFPSGPGKWQVSTDGGQWPRWRSTGSELYFAAAPNIFSVSVRERGESLEFGVPAPVLTLSANPSDVAHEPRYHRFTVSPDGQRFLMGQPAGGGAAAVGGLADRIALIADGGTEGGAAASSANLTVVLNWARLLNRK